MLTQIHDGVASNGNLRIQILKHSKNPVGEEAITFFWTYERMIHAEVMTHRWSRNYSSSRAIPFATMLKWVSKDPANHVHLGRNQSGMVSGAEVDSPEELRQDIDIRFHSTVKWTEELAKRHDPHKEIINRYLEPWGWITGMATMGRRQFMNFIGQRCTPGANPNIQRVAINCLRLYKSSVPQELNITEWHTPWFDDYVPYGNVVDLSYSNNDLYEALAWSAARSAWCSYNNPNKDADFSKAKVRHDDCVRLLHMTPVEHQLQALDVHTGIGLVPGFASYRMMIPGESIKDVDIDAKLAEYEGRDYII